MRTDSGVPRWDGSSGRAAHVDENGARGRTPHTEQGQSGRPADRNIGCFGPCSEK